MIKNVLSENAQAVAKNRYFMNGEDWEDNCRRVAYNMASVETSNKEKINDSFFEMIYFMSFIPAGRILRNSGRPKGSLFNCYHIGIGDSIEEIGQCLKDCLVLWSTGGGVGINFTPLRPRNDPILGKGGTSSGLVSFLEAFDRVADTIESGGSRRAAAIAHVDISHPEIIDFIDAKITHGKLSHFNISVMINNEFLEAVERDQPWTFRFKQKNYSTVKARDIWNKIVTNMLQCAEPGLINTSNFMKNNSYYFSPVTGCNPCHTGDTLISVADGRGHVPFKQLAEENEDVPVFSRNRTTGKVEIKMMRNPRKTGNKQKIYKIFLDDDMYFRCNETHKVTMVDGTEKQVKDLKPNDDRLHHMTYTNKRECNLNFKVIKIEEDGYEDLYNGTVDDNHNYYVYVGESKTKSGRSKLNYINSKNCGEAILSPGEACDLGSLVLPNFITGSVNTNWKKLETVIKTAVRFLDNVIDVNKYDLREIDIKVHDIRRIGIGVIGLAEYLFAKKVRYGSEKAVAETERVMRFIRDSAYRASVELAIEKGAFPKFEPIQYCKASFVRKLPASLRMDIKKYGVRNCTLLSLAPTGTISLLCEYTGGIEPLFAKAYKRNDRVGERIYIHKRYEELLKTEEETPDWFVDTYDLTPTDHFEIQVACQKYCDAAVSKTINLPKETTQEELNDYLLEYVKDLKGVTVYRDGSRDGQILNKISESELKDYLSKNKKVEHDLEENQVTCATGSCEI